MSAETDPDADPMEDAEVWRALDHEEQSAILDEGLADLRGETDGDSFRHLDDGAKAATLDAIERPPSETERAMQAALEETWTAKVFEGLEDVPTVPFECNPLTASQKARLDEFMGLFARLGDAAAGAATAADVEADVDALSFEDSEHFDSPADAESWFADFLEEITADDAFDADRWRTGRGLRDGTRSELLAAIYTHAQEEAERAMKFRTESGGA
jgi:hypothetical protein